MQFLLQRQQHIARTRSHANRSMVIFINVKRQNRITVHGIISTFCKIIMDVMGIQEIDSRKCQGRNRML